MPRKRDIDPGIWRSAQFQSLGSDTARLAFVAAISLADDLGVGRVDDLRRYADIEPDAALEVAGQKLMNIYQLRDGADTVALYLLPKWCKYQCVNRPSKGKLPLPHDWKRLVPADLHAKYHLREQEAGVVLSDHSVRCHGAPSGPATATATEPLPKPKIASLAGLNGPVGKVAGRGLDAERAAALMVSMGVNAKTQARLFKSSLSDGDIYRIAKDCKEDKTIHTPGGWIWREAAKILNREPGEDDE